ncbi:recombinase family protein [Blastococcus sp. CT_GayMR20]|uniref:recombinase family protein n=1 Tax=Blastococcus sp. CT_GayMR20 TaxID=2559609 RepID=UPI001072FB49|nr:recombinase family protein [Blastococcus sp. CT_GayMR20]TFV66151.1 recombinase family protein [Blastococcus sp. CT_GayMR20]
MSAPRSAAIYARISSDQVGEGLGVRRQLEDCRKLAADLGWQVGEEYVDNDFSAYSGKPRPGYQRMLADLADGIRDGVIVYHLDRLTRRPRELEEFLETLDRAKVRAVRFVTGDADLGTGDGLLVARIMGAVAAGESAAKSRRVKRKMLQNAQLGLPHGRSLRPFGFEDDAITHRPDEAKIIREMAARFVAGESLRSMCTDLDTRGIRSVKGVPWQTHSLRLVLANPRAAGLRAHNGEVIGKAVWKPIISEDLHRRVLATIESRKVSGRRTPRAYLLSGLLRCGKCGNTLFSSRRVDSRRYVCLSGPDHRGCGRLTVTAPPLEALLTEYVLIRLDSPAVADAIAGRGSGDAEASRLSAELAEDRETLDYLAEQFGSRKIDRRQWEKARGPVESRIADTERRLTRITRTDTLTGLGTGDQLRRGWIRLNLDRQAAILRTLIGSITIGPGKAGAQALDPDRVQVSWLL